MHESHYELNEPLNRLDIVLKNGTVIAWIEFKYLTGYFAALLNDKYF